VSSATASFIPAELSLADQAAVIVTDLLYDGLTEADAVEATLRPGLATSWIVRDEATAWTFTIDTERVSPEAVVDHFESLRTIATGSTATVLASVNTVESVGSSRVRFTLDQPNAGFAWLLSGVAMSVVGDDGAPTGRFEVEADDGESLRLRSRADDVPDVMIAWTETPSDAYDQLTVGVVDAAVAPPDALDDAEARYGVTPPARAIARFYVVNTASERFTDPRLREALLAAVDRTTLVADTVDVPAFALDGVLAPTLAGYARSGCGRDCRHDLGRAERLIDASTDEAEQTSTAVRIAITPEQLNVAEAIGDDLTSAGLETDVSALEPNELAAVIAQGDADLYAAGWIAPASSLDAAVSLLFGEDSPVGIDSASNPEVLRFLAEAATTIDDEARWTLLADTHTAATRSGAIIPIAVGKSYLVAAPHAQAIPVRADGTIDLVGIE
jgi:ABC-type transport system substrate-binding protein